MVERKRHVSETTDAMIDYIVETVRRRCNKVITRATAKIIYDGIFARAFENVVETGVFKLPYGWGSFYLRVIGQSAKPRRIPSGEVHSVNPRSTVRYKPGTAVRQLLDGKPRLKPGRKQEAPSQEVSTK